MVFTSCSVCYNMNGDNHSVLNCLRSITLALFLAWICSNSLQWLLRQLRYASVSLQYQMFIFFTFWFHTAIWSWYFMKDSKRKPQYNSQSIIPLTSKQELFAQFFQSLSQIGHKVKQLTDYLKFAIATRHSKGCCLSALRIRSCVNDHHCWSWFNLGPKSTVLPAMSSCHLASLRQYLMNDGKWQSWCLKST